MARDLERLLGITSGVLGPVTGIVAAANGDPTYRKSLVCACVLLVLIWVATVELRLRRLARGPKALSKLSAQSGHDGDSAGSSVGVVQSAVYSSKGRSFLQDFEFGNGDDVKKLVPPVAGHVATTTQSADGTLVIYRADERGRFLMRLYHYFPPYADAPPRSFSTRTASGGPWPVSWIDVLVRASATGCTQSLLVRILKGGVWLAAPRGNVEVKKAIQGGAPQWYSFKLGPLPAGESLVISLELQPGPGGKSNSICIHEVVAAPGCQ